MVKYLIPNIVIFFFIIIGLIAIYFLYLYNQYYANAISIVYNYPNNVLTIACSNKCNSSCQIYKGCPNCSNK